MPREIILIFLIAFALFAMQGLGGYFQIKDYKKAVRRIHKFGNVGIGQKKGKFLSGNLVLIAADKNGTIIRVEVMEGLTFLTKFKEKNDLLGSSMNGKSIYYYLDIFKNMENKKRKYYKGYIQALEALDLRFKNQESQQSNVVN